nr:thiazole biosynthesis protein [Pantoea sp. SoEX]
MKEKNILCVNKNKCIIDIRSIDEQEKKPLKLNNNIKIISIPFYKLKTHFKKLDKNKIWLLYCDNGLMSRLQLLYLLKHGFNNVKIYE